MRHGRWLPRLNTAIAATVATTVALLGLTTGPAWAAEFQRGAQSYSSSSVSAVSAAESAFTDSAANWSGGTSQASGDAGDWSATDLSSAGSWAQGGSSGAYSYSYSLRVPPSAGPVPEVSLSYSSAAHDGLTSGTNNQASWIGDGWGYSPGFIERSYSSCGAEAEQDGNNGEDPTGDLCWDGDSPSITLSLNGVNTAIVLDDATGKWRAATDTNWRIEKLGSPATSSAATTERWKVTTTDGSVYSFAADAANTGSRWTVPVFGNHSGESCYVSGDFAASRCTQAYRWMLDQAVDVHGNMTRYVYGTETGYYSPNVDSEAAAAAYTRSGWLKRIEYGLRSDDPAVKPTGRVQFLSGDRCTSDCYNTSGDPKEANWPDVPWDVDCEAGTGCESYSPAFFSTKRLSEIITEVWNTAGGVFDTVDSWTLTHEIKDYGDNSQKVLWLASIQHTGHVGSATQSMPKVEFGGTFLPNRVDDGSANPMIWRPRLTSIKNETGGVTTVNYSAPECGEGNLPTVPESNTKRCYPTWYTPAGLHEPVEAYFHKYVVASVAETDTTGSADTVWTSYQYSTAGGGTSVLWAWNDSEFTTEDKRTYNQWRGYAQVTTLVGDPQDPQPQLRAASRYYRGLNGQPLPDGSERSVTLTSTRGDTAVDHEALAGQVWEQITYADTTVIGSTTTRHWTKNTATRTHDGGDLQAWMSAPSQVEADTKLSATSWRTTRTTTTYDSYGRASEVSQLGDTAASGDERCMRTFYADNTTKWILQAPSRIEAVAVPCMTTPSRPGDLVGDVRAYYDGNAFGAAPSYGLMTKAETLDHWDSGPVYATLAASTFDALGRQVTTTDALGASTTIAYTPAGAGPVTKVTTTNPLGHTEIGVLAPAWGSMLSATGVNGQVTSATYDALGRRTAVWLPGQSQSGGEVPNLKFAYTVSDTAPSATTTETMIWDQSYLTEVQIFDGLMRPRQTQAETYGGRLITQTEYSSRGQVIYESGANFNSDSGPTADLVRIARSNDVSRTEYVYDGAGRVTDQVSIIKDDEQWRITTAYGGNDGYWQETTTPPDGASATGTLTDALGRTVEVHRYRGNTPTGTYDATSYDYTDAGLLETVTDPAQNVWSFTYDLRGRRIAADDPDSGHSDLSYNAADQVASTTDATGTTLSYEYDDLGRATELWEGAVDSGTLLSEWTYDTAVNGIGLPHKSTNWVDGEAWTQEIRAYTAEGWLNQTYIHLPAGAGALTGSYWQAHTYHPDGSLKTSRAIGAGGLYPETMIYGYNEMGQASRVSGTSADFGAGKIYVDQAVYSPYGQLLQRRLGDPADVGGTSGQTWQTWIYEEGTGRLAEFYFDKDTAGEYDGTNYGIAALAYEYDDAGNVLSITDEPVHTSEALAPETQCFQYDHHRRLTEAWSQAGTDACATTPTASTVGGPADYWSSYAYDTTGNRTSENRWNGSSQNTYDYTFPAEGAAHPHALSEVTSTANGGERTAYTYDQAGYTTSIDRDGDLALLDWTATGRLDTVANGEDTTRFIDDAQGKRVARIDSDGSITAWVAGYELHYNATTGVKQATRYYTHGGSAIAVRVGKGDIQFLSGDHHGTGQWIVNGNTLTTKVRRYDPFGNDRSSTAWVQRDGTYGTDTWPDERGFIGGIDNKNVGLTTIGAREYDPLYGRFISVDPIADYADAQQLNGYAYALNNPATFSDPTGECWTGPGGTFFYPGPCSDGSMSTSEAPAGNKNKKDSGESPTPAAPDSPESPGGQTDGCAPSTPTTNGEGTSGTASTPPCGSYNDSYFGVLVRAIFEVAYTLTVEDAVNCVSDPNWTDCIFAAAGFVPGAGKVAGFLGRMILKYADELLPYADDVAEGAGKACNSFVAGTLVIMADGTVKPIEEVKAGEEVLARDVVTGEVASAVVSDTMTTPIQLRNLVTIEVDTDSDGKPDAEITATAGHAFWVAEQDARPTAEEATGWIAAEEIQSGSMLQTASGTWMQVTHAESVEMVATTFNLAVRWAHTYFVLAGNASLLTHNCTSSADDLLDSTNSIHGIDPDKMAPLQSLSDDELLRAINNPADGGLIQISDDGRIWNGHHRLAELQRRIEAGDISGDVEITFEKYNPGGSLSDEDFWDL